MNKISLVTSFYNSNEIFNLDDKTKNRDGCLNSFGLLRKDLCRNGFDLSTSDINSQESSLLSIHFDYHSEPLSKINYLVIFESELINASSWEKKNLSKFDKVFTWNDELIDNKKFFKINFCHDFPLTLKGPEAEDFNSRKLCTLIAGNKTSSHPLELYTSRVKAIEWFQENAPHDFDLYGVGWDDVNIQNRYFRYIFRKVGLDRVIKNRTFSSYKGKVDSKLETLSKYRFCICYENARDIPGYITEKIFDCFFAGCIPVYWGADNICEHVPKDCFIDMRDFSSFEELHHYLSKMSFEESSVYIDNMYNYLNSDNSTQFKSEFFSNTLVEHVLRDVNK